MEFIQFLADECSIGNTTVPEPLQVLIATLITVIKIVVPLLLVIFGMIDLGKAIVQQKEDDIKKGQKTFISRLIAAVILFMVVSIVQIVVNLAANDNETVWDSVKCIIEGPENR